MRRVLLLLLTVLLTTGAPAAAWAHTRLVSSTPAAGAPAVAPREVVLVFSEPVQPGLSALSVTGPDGQQWADGAPDGDGAALRQPLRAPLPAGTYDVSYRVLAADGHPVTGTLELTATEAAAVPAGPTPSTPTTAAPTTPATAPAAHDVHPVSASSTGGGGLPLLPLVVGGLVVAAAVGLLARRAGRATGA